MNDFKIIFVHGYTATPEADWYPALSPLLQQANIDFEVPALPGDEYPHAAQWLKVIDERVQAAGKPVVLVGHSLGTRAVLLYLECHDVEVEAVLLISALSNDTANAHRSDEEHFPDFFQSKIDMDDVVRKVKSGFTLLHSRDDSDVPFSMGESLARELGGKLIATDGRDHICAPENAGLIFETLTHEVLPTR